MTAPHGVPFDPGDGAPVRTSGRLRVDVAGHQAAVGERAVELPHLQFRLLVALMDHEGEPLTYAQLAHAGWGDRSDRRRELRNAIYRLRRLIGEGVDLPRIEAIPGVGYRLQPRPRTDGGRARD